MLALSFKELERHAERQTARAETLQRQLLETQTRSMQLDTLLKARRSRIADLEVSLQYRTERCDQLEQDNARLGGDLEMSSGLIVELREAANFGKSAKSIIAKLQAECSALQDQVTDFT